MLAHQPVFLNHNELARSVFVLPQLGEGCMDRDASRRSTGRAQGSAAQLIDHLERQLRELRHQLSSSEMDQLIGELEQALATIRDELPRTRPD